MQKKSKIRNFALILYPESCEIEWKSKISEFGIPYYWIYHNKDTKKPHYHVLFCAPNAISERTAKRVAINLGAANDVWQSVVSKIGYLRYLVHRDNPEKHQYDIVEVHTGCGASYDESAILSDSETKDNIYNTMRDMIDYIDNNDVMLYCDFARYCLSLKRSWFDILISPQGRVIDRYIKSLYWAKQQGFKERR